MIPSTELGKALIDILHDAEIISESSVLDFKIEPHSKDRDCELFKDVLAMANSYERPNEDRWIIFGVENRAHHLIGINASHPDLLDGATYQQKLQKIYPHLITELVTVPASKVLNTMADDKVFAAIYIPKESFGEVYELSSPVKNKTSDSRGRTLRYEEGTSFIRDGSSTRPLREQDRVQIRSIKSSLMAVPSVGYEAIIAHPSSSNVVDNLRLLGSWDDKNNEDRALISRMCGKTYSEITRELRPDLDSGIFRIVGSSWMIRDRIQALASIGAHLTGSALLDYAETLGEIISSADGQYSLPADRRLLADINNVSRGCSAAAKRGAASCCACLSNNRELVPNCADDDIDKFVSKVLSILFDADDWRKLASADSVMPLLAEASPRIYLAGIERSLKNHFAISQYLDEHETGLTSTNMGWGLIRGIEICARQGSLLSRAIVLLVRLSPYTTYAKDAITNILLPWLPQTDASPESRIGMGKYLVRREEPAAWSALRGLLPNKTTSTIGTTKPAYLNTPSFSKPASAEEFWHVSRAYCDCALKGVQDNPKRMTDVASDIMSYIAAGKTHAFSDAIRSCCEGLDDKDRYPVWREILMFLKKCARAHDADWIPSDETLRLIAELGDDIAPHDSYYLALLTHSLSDYNLTEDDDINEMHSSALSQRCSSLERTYSDHGFSTIYELISDGCKGMLLGESLVCLSLSTEEQGEVLRMFEKDDTESINTARSYAWFSFRRDQDWFEKLELGSMSQSTIARVLAALPFSRKAWERADGLENDAQRQYWEHVGIALFADEEEASFCTSRLLDVGRTDDVLEVLSHSLKKGVSIKPSAIMEALDHMGPQNFGAMSSYYAQNLIEHLEHTSPGDELCSLELKLSALLHDRREAYIFKRMSSDPNLFAEVISLAYAPVESCKDEKGPSRDSVSIGILVNFLPYWKVVPGASNKEGFDSNIFCEWLDEARFLTRKQGCLDGADIQIGRNLFYAPTGEDGLFLPEVIAEFLDDNESAQHGYHIESINSRGVHWVDPSGKQEDDIADSYEEKACQAESHGYVNLATLMRGISSDYRREAEENRNEARFEVSHE